MNPEVLAALLNFAVKFGLDAALVFAEKAGKPGATIDDAIAALRAVKTGQQYLDETPTPPSGGVV